MTEQIRMSSAELAIRLLTGGESLKSREEAERLLAEIRQPVRAKVLAQEADDVVLFCPDHGDHYASYLSCHCPVADVLRQRAVKASFSSSPAAGDKRTSCGPAPSECDAESGEPCANHEREAAHAEGEHCFCGSECAAGDKQPETEVEQLRARVAELEAQRERRRVRLVALQNDALNMRGALAPNGEDRKVPMQLGDTLTPAVEWLINRVAELEAAAGDDQPEPQTRQCGHDDYHIGHAWADQPHIWCPGHAFEGGES